MCGSAEHAPNVSYIQEVNAEDPIHMRCPEIIEESERPSNLATLCHG